MSTVGLLVGIPLIFGALVGLPQYFCLSRSGWVTAWWVPATALGVVGAFFAVLFFMAALPWSHLLAWLQLGLARPGWAGVPLALFVNILVMGVAAGGIVGMLQLPVLHAHGRLALRWILASALGGIPVLAGVAYIFSSSPPLGTLSPVQLVSLYAAPLAVGGAAYGAITGLALVWLLRDRPRTGPDAAPPEPPA